MKKVAITGGGGFIGRCVVQKWLDEGFDVHVLAFTSNEKQIIESMGAHAQQGDLREENVLRKLVKGATFVVHIAAKVEPFGSFYDFFDVNVRGTHLLLKICKEMNVNTVVLFLTAGLLGYAGRDRVPATEKDLGNILPEDPYVLSKEMVREIAALYDKGDMRVVGLMPTTVYGPGPLCKSNGFTRIIRDYIFHSWRIILGSGKQIRNFVYVEDVAEVTYLASINGSTRGNFILGGENSSMDDFFFTLRKVSKKKRRLFHISRWGMIQLSRLQNLSNQLRRGKSSSIRPVVDRITLDHPIDISKIQSELGFRPTSLEKGIQQTVAWLKKEQ